LTSIFLLNFTHIKAFTKNQEKFFDFWNENKHIVYSTGEFFHNKSKELLKEFCLENFEAIKEKIDELDILSLDDKKVCLQNIQQNPELVLDINGAYIDAYCFAFDSNTLKRVLESYPWYLKGGACQIQIEANVESILQKFECLFGSEKGKMVNKIFNILDSKIEDLKGDYYKLFKMFSSNDR